MKKLFLFTLAALLLLTSCSRRTEEVVYYNRPDGCQIGETIILNAPSHADNVYNAGFERASMTEETAPVPKARRSVYRAPSVRTGRRSS